MYPKWKYHATEPAKIFDNAKEEVAAGEDWQESPFDFLKKVEAEIEHLAEEVTESFSKKKKAARVDAVVEPVAETTEIAGA